MTSPTASTRPTAPAEAPGVRRRLLLALGAGYLALGALLRLGLGLRYGLPLGVKPLTLAGSLLAGLPADAVVAVYLLLPWTLYLALAPPRFVARRWHRSLFTAVLGIAVFGFLYLCGVELFFFDEFESRLNLVAVDYLLYPQEVLVNIWDSYPVLPVLAICVAVAAGLVWPLRRPIAAALAERPAFRRRMAGLAAHVGLAVALGLAVSTHSFDPFSSRVSSELAINGVSSFFEALRTNEIDYHAYYRSGDPQQLFALLASHLATPATPFTRLADGRLDRRFAAPRATPANAAPSPTNAPVAALHRGPIPTPRFATAPTSAVPAPAHRPNLVVVLEESLGAEFVGAYGDSRGLTPELDALASQGILFTHAFATGTRTVRGIEAVVASFPPIPSVSIVRRPGSEGIATWGGVMAELGYHTAFLYGGYAYFDNMEHFFASNGFEVIDRSAIPDPVFANVWGVSDEDLFHHALETFDHYDASGRPFFAVVLSTSNHKPFTFRPGVPGVPESGGGRLAGVRYADHAIGELIRGARERPWFDDTVFVIVADHGARVYGKAQIPLRSYEIPMLVLAPGRFAPRRVDVVTSQVDLAPTVLGLMGLPFEAPFFGQNVLGPLPAGPRELLFNHNHDVALLSGDVLTVLGLRQEVDSYRVDPETLDLARIETDEAAVRLATAYYQTAYDQFENGRYR